MSSWFRWLLLAFALSSWLSTGCSAFVGLRQRQGAVNTRHRNNMNEIQQQQLSSLPNPLFPLHICSVHGERVGFEIPLLDLSSNDSDNDKTMIVPLPSTHLPDEMTTLHVYGMELKLPVHQMIVQAAMDRGYDVLGETEHAFGQVVYKPPTNEDGSWVGAIGCASQVLIPSLQDPNEDESSSKVVDELGVATQRILVRGMYRFIVREIKQSVPFVVAVVDELVDDPPSDDASTVSKETGEEEDDEDEDEDDMFDDYDDLNPLQLEQRLMVALKEHVDQQLDLTEQAMSPLERSIIEESTGVNVQRQAAEEMAAVFEVFQQYIIDLCPSPVERYYALSFMAAEMTNLPNSMRKKILCMTQGLQRLRVVLREIEQMVRMTRARKMASSITDKADESEKDLQVGQPELPPWATSIRRGMRLEYFWNEEYEWCVGTVVEDPQMVVDELILTVHFEDDDTIHKLPFRPDEKARWRPTRD